MALADEDCRPSARLSEPEIAALLTELDSGWTIRDDRLHRKVRFPDFAQGLSYVNAIGAVAEAQNHHPDLLLAWGKVEIVLWTHSQGGLTRSDFVLAAKIDRLTP